MKSLSIVVFAAALATLAGCAAEQTSSDSASTSNEDMIISTVKLSGAYHSSEGSADGIKGIVFNTNGHFFADVDTGVRCIKAPCEGATARLSGTYQITGHSVVLSPVANATNEFYGRYDVVIADSGVVSFTHAGEGVAPLAGTLEPAASYCAAAVDCGAQNLIHPMCAPGGWTCNEVSACSFKCGN